MKKKYELIAGMASRKFETVNECKKMHAAFSLLISQIAKCIKVNSLKTAEFKFSKGDEKLNLKFSNSGAKNGEILVEISGSEDAYPGVPYYSNWDGMFYRSASHKKKPFVKNGQSIKIGQPVGVIFINKNEQFILNAPDNGIIYFPKDDRYAERGMPINIYDEAGGDEPIFYLK